MWNRAFLGRDYSVPWVRVLWHSLRFPQQVTILRMSTGSSVQVSNCFHIFFSGISAKAICDSVTPQSFRKFPILSGISIQILTSHHEPLTFKSLYRTELVNRTSLASSWMNFTNVLILSSVNWLPVTCVHLLKHVELKYASKSLHTTKKKEEKKRKTKQKRYIKLI